MPRAKIDSSIIEEMKKLDSEGVKRTEIAKRFNKHSSQISKWLGKRVAQQATDVAENDEQNAAGQDANAQMVEEGTLPVHVAPDNEQGA